MLCGHYLCPLPPHIGMMMIDSFKLMNIESSLKRGQMAAIMTIVNDINIIGLPRAIFKWEAQGFS